MKNAHIIGLLILFFTIETHAQLPEKPEDISPLLIGETLPIDQITHIRDGDGKYLTAMLQDRPSVILFYRGGWCPYCNQHLSAVGEIEENITALGYQVIGVSPDQEKALRNAMKKNKLNYALFSDADGGFSSAMGIAYKAPERYLGILKESSGGKNTEFLPVPSLFVVDTKGVIIFEYIAPDYKKRISAELLMHVLKTLKP